MNTGDEPGIGVARRAMSRRRAAGLIGAAWVACAAVPSRAASPRGLVLPRLPAPDWPLTDVEGRTFALSRQLRGRVTAVQMMFAGCTTTCPVQGAIFAEVARRLPGSDTRLLSLTVDPLGDGPQQLGAWLDRFGRPAVWTAAAPRAEHVDALGEFLRGLPPARGTHSTQVFLFDREARLAFRTVDMPSPAHVVDLIGQLARA